MKLLTPRQFDLLEDYHRKEPTWEEKFEIYLAAIRYEIRAARVTDVGDFDGFIKWNEEEKEEKTEEEIEKQIEAALMAWAGVPVNG